jgi:hypothetical protein
VVIVYSIVPGLLDLDAGTVPGFTFEEVEPGLYRRVARAFPIDDIVAADGLYCGEVKVPEGHP